MQIVPYATYIEEERHITFNAKLSKDDFNQLLNYRYDMNGSFFPVMVDKEEHLMRFGAVAYSEHEEFNKVQATLVYKESDLNEEDKEYVLNVKPYNVDNEVSKLRLINEKLLNILLDKGILSDQDKTDLLNLSKREVHLKSVELYKVSDLDEYQI